MPTQRHLATDCYQSDISGVSRRQELSRHMLHDYEKKRNFQVTAEPRAEIRAHQGALQFVVQKHAARRLHYDLRLELDGVLLSWAVPKGPSLNPEEKRLAVQTEDHPFDYQYFEGVIPVGQYGAGAMIIWDSGTYAPDWNHIRDAASRDEQTQIRKALAEGKITFVLQGEKLQGSWTLIQLNKNSRDWLLRKNKDKFADEAFDITELELSVATGRSIEDVRNGKPSRPGKTTVPDGASTCGGTHKHPPLHRWWTTPVSTLVQEARNQFGSSMMNLPQGSQEATRTSLKPQTRDILNQLDNTDDKLVLHVEGHEIAFSNLNKVFWPATGGLPPITKREYARYLIQVAQYVLPHLWNRPITLFRFPNGINGSKFYQKHWEHKLPEYVHTVDLFGQDANSDQQYMLCNNLPTLMWLAQIADLELHTWHSRVMPDSSATVQSTVFTGSVDNLERSILNYPDVLTFDLDPYIYSGKEKQGDEPELNEKAFHETCRVARLIKEIMDSIHAEAFIKTTGKTGLHLYVPLVRNLDFYSVRDLSEAIGRLVLREFPELVTLEWSVAKRTGKIFVDCNMNIRGKTLASIYSPRVVSGAPVSVPLKWEELGEVYPTDFTVHSVPARLQATGDLWANMHSPGNDLTDVFRQTQANSAKKRRRR